MLDAAVDIEPISACRLPKTGIFAVSAGDFQDFGRQMDPTATQRPRPTSQKPAKYGPFLRPRHHFSKVETAWLATQC